MRLSAALGELSLDRREPILVGIAVRGQDIQLGKGCWLAAPAAAVTAALMIAAARSASEYFGAIFVNLVATEVELERTMPCPLRGHLALGEAAYRLGPDRILCSQ